MKLPKLLPVLFLLAAACGGNGDAGDGADATTTRSASTRPTTTTAPPSPRPAESPSPGRTAACSAAELSEDVPEPPNLPAPVAMMRKEILKAAVNCEYDLLQALAMRPDGAFQYSTTEESAGPNAQPARFWQEREEAGEQPLKVLVEILTGTPQVTGVREPEGPGSGSDVMYYNWPATPHPQNYRTTITSEGDWIFFLRES